MIIEDNFVKGAPLLKALRSEADTLYQRGTFWKTRKEPAVNTTEELCQLVFNKFCKDDDYAGFEYWVNRLSPKDGNSLDWHSDKDEYLAEKTGKLVCPSMGMVLYLHEDEPEGGYLEIDDERYWDKELERIRALPNRFILFDPSIPHRVTPTKTLRITLAANLWKKAPSMKNFSHKKFAWN